LTIERAVDLIYMYTNSKVVAALKEKDEKKWYHGNVESKAGCGSEDEDDGPHALDKEAENNNMFN